MSANKIIVPVKGVDQQHELSILVNLVDTKLSQIKNQHEFFVLRRFLGISFEDVLKNWFSVCEKIRTPSRLAVSILSSDKVWLNIEFLSLMQALEGFHRALYPGTYTSDKEYEAVKLKLYEALPTGISEGHKEALKSKIKYGNDISLSRRITELGKMFSSEVRKALFGSLEKPAREWVETRNYYTHWDEVLSEVALSGSEMYNSICRLKLFLRALYLDLMKIPQEEILRALQGKSSEAQYLLQINREEGTKTPKN